MSKIDYTVTDLEHLQDSDSTCPTKKTGMKDKAKKSFWIWIIVIFIILIIVFYLWKPAFILSVSDGEARVDWFKLILWTLIGTAIIGLILYLIFGSKKQNAVKVE